MINILQFYFFRFLTLEIKIEIIAQESKLIMISFISCHSLYGSRFLYDGENVEIIYLFFHSVGVGG